MSVSERDTLEEEHYISAKYHSTTRSGIVLVTLFHDVSAYYDVQIHWHPATGNRHESWTVRWANEGSGNNKTALDWMIKLAREHIPYAARAKGMHGAPGQRTQEFDADFPALT